MSWHLRAPNSGIMPWNDISWLDFRIAPFWWQINHMDLFVRITLFLFLPALGMCRQICWLYITCYYSYKRKTSLFNRMCECLRTIRNFGLHSLLHADTCITYKCLRLLLCIEKNWVGHCHSVLKEQQKTRLSFHDVLWWTTVSFLSISFSTRSNNDIRFIWT